MLFDKVAQDVDVSMRLDVCCENVMVGDDDDLLAIEDLGVFAEFTFKNTDRSGTAHVVGQQDVDIDPDIVTWHHVLQACSTGKDFLCYCHFHL